jgi:outer membrane protein assembly factor BamB
MTRQICAFTFFCLYALANASADWPLFRGDSLQTGVSKEKLPDKLEILWKFATKEAIESTAAIAGGMVYVGSYDEHLYAIDLVSGKEKWKFKAGPIKAAVSYKDGNVYAGNIDGDFHCFEAATGKKRWTFKTDGEISSGANFNGDNVLFGSGDEHLYCVSKDGKEVWKYKVPGGPVMGSPALAGERTFAAGCDSVLHVLDVVKGKEVGKVEIGSPVGASAAVVGDRLYVGTMSSNEVLAIDWQKPAIIWKFQAPKLPNAFVASVAATDNLIITGSKDKRVWAIDRKTGKEAWSFPTEKQVTSSPVVVGQRVFAGSLDGKLYVLDLAKGTLLQKLDLGGPISASPAVGSGCLVIGTEKGLVYCFGAKP